MRANIYPERDYRRNPSSTRARIPAIGKAFVWLLLAILTLGAVTTALLLRKSYRPQIFVACVLNEQFPIPPNAYGYEDGKRLSGLVRSGENEEFNLQTKNQFLDQLESFLGSASPTLKSTPFNSRNQSILFYISAFGTVDAADSEAQPVLLFDTEDPAVEPLFQNGRLNPSRTLKLSELFEKIEGSENLRDCRKILFLDAVKALENWDLGIAHGSTKTPSFYEALDRFWKNRKDDQNDVVLISSSSEGQYSHASHLRGGTVFGSFLADAIAGDADENKDKTLSVRELVAFLESNVRDWTKSNFDASQQVHAFLPRDEERILDAIACVVPKSDSQNFSTSLSDSAEIDQLHARARELNFSDLATYHPVPISRYLISMSRLEAMWQAGDYYASDKGIFKQQRRNTERYLRDLETLNVRDDKLPPEIGLTSSRISINPDKGPQWLTALIETSNALDTSTNVEPEGTEKDSRIEGPTGEDDSAFPDDSRAPDLQGPTPNEIAESDPFSIESYLWNQFAEGQLEHADLLHHLQTLQDTTKIPTTKEHFLAQLLSEVSDPGSREELARLARDLEAAASPRDLRTLNILRDELTKVDDEFSAILDNSFAGPLDLSRAEKLRERIQQLKETGDTLSCLLVRFDSYTAFARWFSEFNANCELAKEGTAKYFPGGKSGLKENLELLHDSIKAIAETKLSEKILPELLSFFQRQVESIIDGESSQTPQNQQMIIALLRCPLPLSDRESLRKNFRNYQGRELFSTALLDPPALSQATGTTPCLPESFADLIATISDNENFSFCHWVRNESRQPTYWEQTKEPQSLPLSLDRAALARISSVILDTYDPSAPLKLDPQKIVDDSFEATFEQYKQWQGDRIFRDFWGDRPLAAKDAQKLEAPYFESSLESLKMKTPERSEIAKNWTLKPGIPQALWQTLDRSEPIDVGTASFPPQFPKGEARIRSLLTEHKIAAPENSLIPTTSEHPIRATLPPGETAKNDINIEIFFRGHRRFYTKPLKPTEFLYESDIAYQPKPLKVTIADKPKIPLSLVVVLDCSYSMEAKNQTKEAENKKTEELKERLRDLEQALRNLEEDSRFCADFDVHIGFVLFGHRYAFRRKQSDSTYVYQIAPLYDQTARVHPADDVETVNIRPLSEVNFQEIENKITAWGVSPLNKSINEAMAMLRKEEKTRYRFLYIVSDGVNETYQKQDLKSLKIVDSQGKPYTEKASFGKVSVYKENQNPEDLFVFATDNNIKTESLSMPNTRGNLRDLREAMQSLAPTKRILQLSNAKDDKTREIAADDSRASKGIADTRFIYEERATNDSFTTYRVRWENKPNSTLNIRKIWESESFNFEGGETAQFKLDNGGKFRRIEETNGYLPLGNPNRIGEYELEYKVTSAADRYDLRFLFKKNGTYVPPPKFASMQIRNPKTGRVEFYMDRDSGENYFVPYLTYSVTSEMVDAAKIELRLLITDTPSWADLPTGTSETWQYPSADDSIAEGEIEVQGDEVVVTQRQAKTKIDDLLLVFVRNLTPNKITRDFYEGELGVEVKSKFILDNPNDDPPVVSVLKNESFTKTVWLTVPVDPR